MLKTLSLVVTIAAIFLGILSILGFSLNPIIQFICIISVFITFLPIAFKWNIYCLKNYGLFNISAYKESFKFLQIPFRERKKNKFRFILVISWFIYFILFLVLFQIAVMNAQVSFFTRCLSLR